MIPLDLSAWFARPLLLGALVTVPVLALLAWRAGKARRRALLQLGNAVSMRRLAQIRPRRRRWRDALALAGLFCLAVACADPQWGWDPHAWRAPEGDLVVVLDLSRSMQAEQPSRRERALRALRDLATELDAEGRCRIALVAFAGRPRLLFPLTRDYAYFRHALDQVEADDLLPLAPGPDEPFVSGTRLGAALCLAVQTFDPAAARPRTIVLLSDGDDPGADQEWHAGIEAARLAHVAVHVVGLGDPSTPHTIPDRGGVLQHAGAIVHTRLDEDVLQEIARRTGGTYLPARTDSIPLGSLVSALLAQRPLREEDAGRAVPAQRYVWFLVPALIFFTLSMLLGDGRSLSIRPRLALLALLPALLSAAGVRDLIRQGNEAFARQEYETALDFYAQAEATSDDPGLVAFNRGSAFYRLGRYHEAEVHFRRCLEDDQAPELRRARAELELGNALVRQGDDNPDLLAQAVVAYRTCSASSAADTDLRADARHNLELAQLLWLKAKAQRPAQPPGPSAETKRDQEPPGGQEGKSGSESGTNTPQRKNGQGVGPPQNGSKKAAPGPLQTLPDTDTLTPLTRAEAEAHLDSLAARIAQQRRHHRQQTRPTTGAAKDW